VAQAGVTVPPLTTVAQPIGAMAERALALLRDGGPTGTETLAPRLVVRGSG
jgi:DNA-binding LacI/PurR family transcriptional regulator